MGLLAPLFSMLVSGLRSRYSFHVAGHGQPQINYPKRKRICLFQGHAPGPWKNSVVPGWPQATLVAKGLVLFSEKERWGWGEHARKPKIRVPSVLMHPTSVHQSLLGQSQNNNKLAHETGTLCLEPVAKKAQPYGFSSWDFSLA